MKLKALIVDDEMNAIRSLEILLSTYCPELEIVASATSVEQAILSIQEFKPDLVFLDIEMPSGSGFEVVEKTKSFNYKIIFTTAYEQYAQKAFRVSAIDYLLKPIDPEELKTAVNKLGSSNNYQNTLQAISDYIKQAADQKISIPTNDGFRIVPIEQIVRIESDSNYCWLFFDNGNKTIIPKTLKEMELQLLPFHFIRVHNSHLVNKTYIHRYIKSEGGTIVLTDGTEIPISRRKKADVLAIFS